MTAEPTPIDASAGRRKGRIPPFDREAEESLLGSMMLSRTAIEAAVATVRADDFYVPLHQALYQAMTDMLDAGRSVDPVTLYDWLQAHPSRGITPQRSDLLSIQATTPASANAEHYARTVVAHSSRRKLIAAGGEITELGYDPANDPGDIITRATELLTGAEIPLGGQPSLDVGAFLAQTHTHEWAWPGILEVSDRLLIVAPEKYGKSTMIRQIAVCLSQGQDPFRDHRIPHVLVHVVDLENPPQLVQRKVGDLIATMDTLDRQVYPETLRIDCRPEGLDITRRRDALWLQERIAANRAEWTRHGFEADYPMVLAIGPVYKLHENELDLAEVRKVQRELDLIRTRFRCALVMETHAPHESFGPKMPARSLRPAGPRVWIRWPEFCKALEPSTALIAQGRQDLADFYDVSGARDERDWPRRLKRGGRLPWVEDRGL